MNQELQDSVRFSDLVYTIKATLSHKITISNVLLERFCTVALEVASKHCTLVGFAHYTSAGFVVIH